MNMLADIGKPLVGSQHRESDRYELRIPNSIRLHTPAVNPTVLAPTGNDARADCFRLPTAGCFAAGGIVTRRNLLG